MKRIDLSIIIVSYNTKDLSIECIQSIFDNVKTINFEIIVVDNKSSDDSVTEIKKRFPQVKLLALSDNLGFSKANNKGVEIAKGRYVLFLNSDTVVYPGSLEYMVEFMDKHEKAGAATCFLKMPNGKLDDAAHRGFPTPWNAITHFSGLSKIFPNSIIFNGYHMAWKDIDKIHEIDALAGAFMIVRRSAGEEVGWWDEDYFFYGEDIDFCYMLKQKGWKIYFVPTVSTLHYKGASGGIKKESQKITTASLETKKKVTIARFNAMKIFYRKHYQDKYPPFIYWLVMKAVDVKKNFAIRSI